VKRWRRNALLAVAWLSTGCLGDGRPLDEYLGDLGRDLPDSGLEPDAGVDEPHACSARNSTPARLHFVNGTAEIVFYYWVDWDCREVLYGSLTPSQEADQGTFVGHVWNLRSARSGALLLQHVTEGSETVTVGAP
jgi:hypothetical protein